jgi:hypothetical protein
VKTDLSKSVPELEIDDGEYRIARHRLSAEKQALQGQLSEINAKCSMRLKFSEYHKLQKARSELVKQLAEKEIEIGELNSRRAELSTVIEVRKHQEMGRHDIRQLVHIRDTWHAFSMDKANHQKAREAAWKFSQELGDVLKRFFSGGAKES